MKKIKIKACDRLLNKEKVIWSNGKKCKWVEGFKGTDEKMQCRGFQFEIGKIFKEKTIVEVGKRGFHFCTELKEVFEYYGLNRDSRYFKVRALVPIDIIKDRKTLASCEIEFIEELGYDDLKDYIPTKHCVESAEEWESFRKLGSEIFKKNKFVKGMCELDFSELFSKEIYERLPYDEEFEALRLAKILKEEGMQKEMLIFYLLTEHCN